MTLRYEVTPGAGIVVRSADSIMWVTSGTSESAWEALSDLLDLEPGEEQSGADTASRLDDLQRAMERHPDTSFAALLVSGETAQGILRGPVTVRNATELAPTTGHGQVGITLPFPMTEAVYVGSEHGGANAQPGADLLDLHAGIVPGSGAWIHPVAGGRRLADDSDGLRSSGTAAPDTASVPAQTDSLAPLDRPETLEPPVPAAEERIDLRDLPAPATDPLPPIGVSQAPEQQSTELPRPGRLVFDDGSTFPIDRDYVVGRRPEKDERVRSGAAEALTVVDPDSVLSSAHALISRRDGAVLLRDLGSLNGTHLAAPGETDWTRLESGQELPIVPGTRLLFGWTVATYTGDES